MPADVVEGRQCSGQLMAVSGDLVCIMCGHSPPAAGFVPFVKQGSEGKHYDKRSIQDVPGLRA